MTDRRTTLKWMVAAAASMPLLGHRAGSEPAPQPSTKGYGTDPNLTKIYQAGELWPLTFTAAQRRTATALCNVILPDDGRSPSAESVGIVDFLDEWISAPYPRQQEDRPVVLEGLAWMDAEALLRFEKYFAEIGEPQQHLICDDVCLESKTQPRFARAAAFFTRYRDLTVGGYYSTAAGRQDLGYMGNVPLAKFDPPDPQVLRNLGLDPA